jgi:hypothetical protein
MTFLPRRVFGITKPPIGLSFPGTFVNQKPFKFTFQFATMTDPHNYPSHIFTNQLHISHIIISHKTSDVTLLGCYGGLLDPGMTTISIETHFASLNDLLAEAGEEAEEVIDQISQSLVSPAGEQTIIDLSDGGGLFFSELMFSFLLINEEEVKIPEVADYTYLLVSWMPCGESFTDLVDGTPPQNLGERLTYFNSLLAIQYRFYLAYRKKMDNTAALFGSNLTDPLAFKLAETQYQLQKSGHTT